MYFQASQSPFVYELQGYNVTVYERYEDIRAIPVLGRSIVCIRDRVLYIDNIYYSQHLHLVLHCILFCRSINLVLTSRGLRALRMVSKELVDGILNLGTKVVGRVMHQLGSEVRFSKLSARTSCHAQSGFRWRNFVGLFM
jgi:hypothetical protein